MSARGRGADGAVAIAVALAAFAACLVGWQAGGGAIDVPWAPSLGMRLQLTFDGLAALYALLATGIGAAVFVFAAGYMPWHLEREGRPRTEARRFWPWMVLFMGSMVGLACADDLLLLFVFFDLTAVSSYFLIGFDRGRLEARGAAMMALLVTGVSAVAILVAAALLYTEYGTFSLPELFESAAGETTGTVAGALIAAAALAKSAQVPFHFWLPRAMEAPTPVSAYLHSAAMVAAGVLVLGRVHPLMAPSELLLDALLAIGFASVVVGGVLALRQDELKQVLAYSTISQYGYVVMLYGIGGAAAAGAAALYVIAHGIAKSALFMTAGAVAVASGESRLSRLGGLAGRLPVLAVGSGVAAASLAALPLTLGFFKDELFFAAARGDGPLLAAMAIVAAALTFAYIGRFWLGIFGGPRGADAKTIGGALVGPVVALAGVALVGGLFVTPFAELAEDAATVTNGGPVTVEPAYHLDAGAENLMALAAWLVGACVLAFPRVHAAATGLVAAAGERFGPRRLYAASLRALNVASDRIHAMEVRDLRNSLAAVLLPGGILIGLGFAVTPTAGFYDAGGIASSDLPILAVLALAVIAALSLVFDLPRLSMVLSLSVVGFGLAAAYALMGAPDVALVAVVAETVVSLVFLGVLRRLPRQRARATGAGARSRRRRNAIVGLVAGAAVFATIWGALSRATVAPGDAVEQIERAPAAHGGDVVTVILADFRGLDTLGEISVLALAIVGFSVLMRRRSLW